MAKFTVHEKNVQSFVQVASLQLFNENLCQIAADGQRFCLCNSKMTSPNELYMEQG